jgi:threonine/homoserine/homoserine lactone efflux protein
MSEQASVATIEWRSLGPLLLTSLAIMGSPGPATISLTMAGSAYGVHRTVGYLGGVIAGTSLVLVAVATGITAALLAVPAIRVGLLAISATYILWLAYRVAGAPAPAPRTSASNAPTFTGGALLGVANPKAWLAIAAVFATTRLAGDATVDAAAKGAVLAGMIVLINTGWLLAGACFSRILRNSRGSVIVNRVLAVTLVGATALALFR